MSSNHGSIDKEQRISVAVRWDKVPPSSSKATLIITGPGQQPIPVDIVLEYADHRPTPGFRGFIETNHTVAIEAEHFSTPLITPFVSWQVIPGLGRTLSGVMPVPEWPHSEKPRTGGPHLQYDVWLTDTGEIHVRAFCSPIIAFEGKPIHYAIGFDDEQPQVIDITTGNEKRGTWDKMVADNIKIAASTHHIAKAGPHILKFYMIDDGVVLQRLVIDARGVKPSYLGPPESPRRLLSGY